MSNTKDLVVNHKTFSMFEIGLTGELMYPNGWGGNIGLSTILSSGKWMESITSDLSTGSNNINSILEVIDGFNVTNRLMLKIGITKRL